MFVVLQPGINPPTYPLQLLGNRLRDVFSALVSLEKHCIASGMQMINYMNGRGLYEQSDLPNSTLSAAAYVCKFHPFFKVAR